MDKSKSRTNITGIARAGVLAALYVVLTMLVQPLAYGPFQVRISEMFNHMVDFNKRYIYALTLGCLIVNSQSPLGPVDMIVGTSGTFISAILIWVINKHVSSTNHKLVISTIIPTVIGMLPIAIELHFLQHVPFWLTYGTSMTGEFISLVIGAFLIKKLSKYIDLTK